MPDAFAAENAALRAAFIKHRTATHEVKPKSCVTCQESDATLATEPVKHGAAILAAAERMAVELSYVLEAHSNATRFHDALNAYRALVPEPADGPV